MNARVETAPTRPVLRYYGGKWRLASWLAQHLPPHRVYVEPFAGGASLLLRKPRAHAEVYNDLCTEVVNLFRVLRDPARAEDLAAALRLTPFARDEWRAAYEPATDPVERARRLVVRSYMGHGADAAQLRVTTGFRADTARKSTTAARDWCNYPDALTAVVHRLRGVVIENRDALACMAQHDGPGTLHYLDPPYLPATRRADQRRHDYAHEMAADDHARLLAELPRLRGMVVLSGYPHPDYDDALIGWRRMEREALADHGNWRTEVLWINPAAVEAARRASGDLFARAFEPNAHGVAP